jgi:putative toxin-antitoxin system antitoxin component (TIGR02293 family)
MNQKTKRRSPPQQGTKTVAGMALGHRDSRTSRIGLPLNQAPARDIKKMAASVLSGHGLDRSLSDRITEVRDGLPISELDQVASLLTISREQLAQILGITVRTLQRKAGADERLGPAASDRLARVRRIHDLAIHVLGDQQKASRWMTSVSRPLGGQLPVQLLDTDIGTQRVEQELYQIKYSIPA